MNPVIEGFERDVRTILSNQFDFYQKGWKGQIGMALVDAIYSKQRRYKTKRGMGLLPRLLAFKDQYPQAGIDLRELLKLSEADLLDVLGYGIANGRNKSSAVLEAARRLVQLGVYTHEQYSHLNQEQRDSYLHVHGLSPVKHNYFLMLLGYPDTKTDPGTIRAVQRMTTAERWDVEVNSKLARTVVGEVPRRTKLND